MDALTSKKKNYLFVFCRMIFDPSSPLCLSLKNFKIEFIEERNNNFNVRIII